MKKITIVFLLVLTSLSYAKSLDKIITEMAKENAKGYLQPFANAQSSTIGSGYYQTADVLKPLRFGVMINTTMTFVPSDEKTFSSKTVNDVGEFVDVESATIFGDKGKGGLPNGLDIPVLAFPYPQVNIGVPFNSEVNFRFLPEIEINDDLGEFSFWGIGAKHDLDSYLTGLFPFHIAVQTMFQKMKLGESIEISNFSADLMVSKSLIGFTLYGGLGIRNNSVEVNYEWDNPLDNTIETEKIDFELETENNFAMTVGTRFSLLLIRYYVEGSYDGYPSARAGLGMSF